MGNIKIENSNGVQVSIGKDNKQVQCPQSRSRKVPKSQKNLKAQKTQKEPAKAIENPKPPIPYLSELESEIADIFKSVYQKDRKPGISEVNAKKFESLKHKLHDLKASGNDIQWLDMGCGDGRCLEVLDDIQDRGNIYYHGIDISHKFLDEKISEFERGERCSSI